MSLRTVLQWEERQLFLVLWCVFLSTCKAHCLPEMHGRNWPEGRWACGEAAEREKLSQTQPWSQHREKERESYASPATQFRGPHGMCRRDSRGDSAMGHLALKGWESRNPYVINPTAMSEVKPNPGPHSSPVSLHSPLQGERQHKALWSRDLRLAPEHPRPILHLSWLPTFCFLTLLLVCCFLLSLPSLIPHISSFLSISFKWYLNKAGNTSMKYVKNTFSANIY